MRRLVFGVAIFAAAALVAKLPAQSAFYPLDDVKPGQVGIGRTIFAGDTIEEFKVNILGVLHNVIGPQRDLILAKLEGGPLATTGVIQGMSGSPVYIDGRLVGAVSYALGSFPREPFAGITPIREMTDAVSAGGTRAAGGLALTWPATSTEAFAYLNKLAERAAAPLRASGSDIGVVGPPALADLVPTLRPIGAAMVFSGFEPGLDRELRQAFSPAGVTAATQPRPGRAATTATELRPGDAVGVSLVRGDLEMGATGTVTYVDGSTVYAFGHPFLNLGPTQFAMTRAHVYTVLPSLDSSLKIASLGPVIGTMSQDRATAIGGTLGAPPRELAVTITLAGSRGPDRKFTFYVLHDQMLTPLFSYVAILNALTSYQRQAGVMSIGATGTLSFGDAGKIDIDDAFTGESALSTAATTLTAPIGAAITNEYRSVMPDALDLTLRVTEEQRSSTIDRVWLDTTKPRFGATHAVQVQLRDYRGATEVVSIPVVMPNQATGPLTLLVSDAQALTTLEQRDLRPGKPASWNALLAQMNDSRRNNRLYVRLISPGTGTVVGGQTLSALPANVRSILDADSSVPSSSISKAVVGAWERKFDRVVRGSREITITLSSDK
ncbi:MAG TPA: SpoIVB peptidase S55 domain-containing protein [Vicinamibacterales bacterium]|nr:SpoIVB peptidase S55 domain-containing protein [Vicinamibacterales bacterium]